MITTTESVRDIAMRLRDQHADPIKLADAVMRELSHRGDLALRDALSEVLPGYVAGMIRSSRNTTIKGVPAFRSAKIDAQRAWHTRWLGESLHTADGWKRIADTTEADWTFAAEERAAHVAAETVRMNQCRAMAALFRRHGVQFAADLPSAAVQAVFSRTA